ncbi:MAG: HepT-like ribonuclease domain-containing protein [Thermoplasmataceae archaeon]
MIKNKRGILLLNQIVESIELIMNYISGLDIEDFLEQKQIQDAVLRRLQIIG